MGTTFGKRESTVAARVLGNVTLIFGSVIIYVIGMLIAGSGAFYAANGYNLDMTLAGVRYWAAISGVLVAVVLYNVFFSVVANRDPFKYNYQKVSGNPQPFVFSGWTVFAIISGVGTLILSLIVHFIAFSGDLRLVVPLMLWLWLVQCALCIGTFFIPAFKPLKKI